MANNLTIYKYNPTTRQIISKKVCDYEHEGGIVSTVRRFFIHEANGTLSQQTEYDSFYPHNNWFVNKSDVVRIAVNHLSDEMQTQSTIARRANVQVQLLAEGLENVYRFEAGAPQKDLSPTT